MVPFIVVAAVIVGVFLIAARANRPAERVVMALSGSMRCSQCGVNWPRLLENGKPVFQPCPECQGATSMMAHDPSVTTDDALSRLRHALFERFYADEWLPKRAEEEAKALHKDLDAFTSSPSKERAA